MPTPKQKTAAKKIGENRRNKKTLGKILEESGYSEHTTTKPSQVTESAGFKEAAKPIIQQLEEARQQALNRMKQTVDKASYADTTRTAKDFTTTIELLGGKPTVITKDLTQEQVDQGIRDGLAYLKKSGALPEHSGQDPDGEEGSFEVREAAS